MIFLELTAVDTKQFLQQFGLLGDQIPTAGQPSYPSIIVLEEMEKQTASVQLDPRRSKIGSKLVTVS